MTPPPPPTDFSGGGPTGPYSATDSIGYGWKKFTENLGPILGAMVVLFVGWVVVVAILVALFGGLNALGLNTAGEQVAVGVSGRLLSLLIGFLSLLVSSAVIRATLAIVDGRKLDFSEFFALDQMGQVVVAAILLSLVNAILGFIPILGTLLSLAVSVFGMFIMFFILDDKQDAIPAITSSVNFVAANIGQVLLFIVLAIVVGVVGALLCGVGLIVALPVIAIAEAYTYRRLRNQPVAA